MKLIEVVVSMTVVLGAGAIAVTSLNVPKLIGGSQQATAGVSCHTVRTAVASYATEHDAPPGGIDDLRPYVQGDISAYRIVPPGLEVVGPGCAGSPSAR